MKNPEPFMRILQICNKPPYPPTDGGTFAMLQMNKGLRDQGIEVDCLAMTGNKHKSSKQQSLPKSFMYQREKTEPSRCGGLLNLVFQREPYTATRFFTSSFAKRIAQCLNQSHYDIVQLESTYLAKYIPVIRDNSSAKIALRPHNIESHIWKNLSGNTKNSLLKNWYFKNLSKRISRFEKSILNKYDYLVPITAADLETYNDMGNTKAAIAIPTGIVSAAPTTSTPNHQPRLYFLGAFDWRPNTEGLVWFLENAWPLITAKMPEARLHVAGRNASPTIKEKIKASKASYYGEVESAKAFIEQNDILVAPVFSGSGMRIKILEAMNHAKVVVTTKLGIEGINAKNNHNVVICSSANDFADKIIQLIKSPKQSYEIGKRAKELVQEEYDLKSISSRLAEFYIRNK